MVNEHFIVYVAAPYSRASPELGRFVHDFKDGLRRRTTAVVLEWAPEDVAELNESFFNRDMGNVHMCDLLIAIMEEPSIGVGIELAEAIRIRKRVFCLYPAGSSVSRLLRAAASTLPIGIEPYETHEEAIERARSVILNEQALADSSKIQYL
jgi:hypothetical protein